jgi:hypothetical protein
MLRGYDRVMSLQEPSQPSGWEAPLASQVRHARDAAGRGRPLAGYPASDTGTASVLML